jgi:hypothetical protein
MSGGPYPKGGMSPEGTTTPVYINFAQVSGKDKDVLCMAICECKDEPEIGKKGQSLRQVCVSRKLNKHDYSLGFQSEYKSEINYDMTKNPPVPIMNYEIKTMAHEWLPGWIEKHWNDDPTHPLWLPGEGYIRRPDVVIVKDPTKPPTQDNIKQVVEIKFDNDPWGEGQEAAYRLIAGPGKLVELTPKMCSCGAPDREKKTDDVKTEEQQDIWLKMVENLSKETSQGGGRPNLPKGPKLPKKFPK